MSDIYKQASRQNLTYDFRGTISFTQLWSFRVKNENGHPVIAELDTIYNDLMAQKEALGKRSLSQTPTAANDVLDLKIAIVKDVFETKINEYNKARQAAEKRIEVERLNTLIAQKQDQEISNMDLAKLIEMRDKVLAE